MSQPQYERRNALVLRHLGLARQAVWERIRYLGGNTPFDELIGAANVGLIQAAERWDPESGNAFSSFAMLRIRGAIWDACREDGFFPKAWKSQLPMEDLDEHPGLFSAKAHDPLELESELEWLWRLAERRLTQQELSVLREKYLREEKQVDIAERMGVSTARVSQILSKAIGKLREEGERCLLAG